MYILINVLKLPRMFVYYGSNKLFEHMSVCMTLYIYIYIFA